MMRSSKSHPVIANDLHSPRLMVGVENTAPSLNNLRRESRQVLGIQMSRWGRDVLHPEGNLLIRFGMIRFRVPGQPGSSRYRCRWADHWIELHSTCAGIYSETGAGIVFLRPVGKVYLFTGQEPPTPGGAATSHWVVPRSPDERARFSKSCALLLAWVEAYERWASDHRTPRSRFGLQATAIPVSTPR